MREISSNCNEHSDIYVRLIFEAGKIGFLFEIAELEDIIKFLEALDQYISDIYKDKTGDIEQLQTAYKQLDTDGIQEKLQQQLNLTV